MNAVSELQEAYEKYSKDPEFLKELEDLYHNYAFRPSLLYYADKMTKEEILASKDPAERQAAMVENHELFGY